jgi:hypothetical protein
MLILIDDSLLIRNLYSLYILLCFSFKIYTDITRLTDTLYPIFTTHSNPWLSRSLWQCKHWSMYRFGRILIMNVQMPERGLCSRNMLTDRLTEAMELSTS